MEMLVDLQTGNVNRIALNGRLDAPGTQSVVDKFNSAVAEYPNVVVDLGKVSFIASVGLRMLVAGAKARSKLGGKMVMVSPNALTQRILWATGLDQLIPAFKSLDEALASF